MTTTLALATFAGVAMRYAPIAGAADEPLLRGYTCCNLHYDGDWISDANWSALPMIPAGSPVRVLEFGRHRVIVEISGRRMTLGLDYGRKQPLSTWARNVVLPEDPKPKIAAWPEPIRNAVREGRIAIGMTKEQVIVAVGYPPAHETPSVALPQWKYWHTTHGTYLVAWNDAGRVTDVIAEPAVQLAVVATGARVGSVPARLPATGSTWSYELSERVYGRKKLRFTVRATAVDDQVVEERISVGGAGSSRIARRSVGALETRFLEYSVDGGAAILEFAPYFLAARGDKAGLARITGDGYPTGDEPAVEWRIDSQPPAWEHVTVPAGTFRSLRVRIEGRRKREIKTMHPVAVRFVVFAWYAPEVGRVIRLEHRTWSGAVAASGAPMSDELIELVAFRPPS